MEKTLRTQKPAMDVLRLGSRTIIFNPPLQLNLGLKPTLDKKTAPRISSPFQALIDELKAKHKSFELPTKGCSSKDRKEKKERKVSYSSSKKKKRISKIKEDKEIRSEEDDWELTKQPRRYKKRKIVAQAPGEEQIREEEIRIEVKEEEARQKKPNLPKSINLKGWIKKTPQAKIQPGILEIADDTQGFEEPMDTMTLVIDQYEFLDFNEAKLEAEEASSFVSPKLEMASAFSSTVSTIATSDMLDNFALSLITSEINNQTRCKLESPIEERAMLETSESIREGKKEEEQGNTHHQSKVGSVKIPEEEQLRNDNYDNFLKSLSPSVSHTLETRDVMKCEDEVLIPLLHEPVEHRDDESGLNLLLSNALLTFSENSSPPGDVSSECKQDHQSLIMPQPSSSFPLSPSPLLKIPQPIYTGLPTESQHKTNIPMGMKNLAFSSQRNAFTTPVLKRQGHFVCGDKPLKVIKSQYYNNELHLLIEWKALKSGFKPENSLISKTEIMKHDPLILVYFYEAHMEFPQFPDFSETSLVRIPNFTC